MGATATEEGGHAACFACSNRRAPEISASWPCETGKGLRRPAQRVQCEEVGLQQGQAKEEGMTSTARKLCEASHLRVRSKGHETM